MARKKNEPKTLGEFRKLTKDMPDDTSLDIFVNLIDPECDLFDMCSCTLRLNNLNLKAVGRGLELLVYKLAKDQ